MNAAFSATRILGSDFSFDIKIKEGAGAFVCGEETALIGSIEGKRGMPRSRPPFPAISGLFGCPTIINNVETLGTLPNIFRNGAEWYTRFGKEGNRGTKTFSLVGKVRRPGLIEVQLGTTLREIIYDIGGGLQKPFKAIQTGGPSGGCLSEEFLDLAVDYESLAAAGSIMGSGRAHRHGRGHVHRRPRQVFPRFHPEGVVRQMYPLPGGDEAHGRGAGEDQPRRGERRRTCSSCGPWGIPSEKGRSAVSARPRPTRC